MTTVRMTGEKQEQSGSQGEALKDSDRLALSMREAAKAIGVSERTLWEYVNRGDMPSLRMGRRVLIPVGSLRAWLLAQAGHDEGEQTAPPGSA